MFGFAKVISINILVGIDHYNIFVMPFLLACSATISEISITYWSYSYAMAVCMVESNRGNRSNILIINKKNNKI